MNQPVKAGLLRALRRYLVAGLLVWAPLGATLLTFKFLLDMVDKLLPLLPAHWQPDELLGFHVPGFGALLAFVVLFFTGFLVANLIGSTLVGWWEDLLNRIPLVRSIYSSFKGLTETLVSSSGSFSKVVLIEYPRREMWSIGFVTASDMPDIGRTDRRPHGLRVRAHYAQSHLRADRLRAGQPGGRVGHDASTRP